MSKRSFPILLLFIFGATGFLASGCGGEANEDPREGRVIIDQDNCITGSCFSITKVCLGPDMIYRDTRLSKKNRERVVKNDSECVREVPTP